MFFVAVLLDPATSTAWIGLSLDDSNPNVLAWSGEPLLVSHFT